MVTRAEIEADIHERMRRHEGWYATSFGDSAFLFLEISRAHRILGGFADKWGVDLHALNYPMYFDGIEAKLRFPEFSWLLRALNPRVKKLWREAPARPRITVAHLIDVAQKGAWFDPPESPSLKSTYLPAWLSRGFSTMGICLGMLVAALILAGIGMELWRAAMVVMHSPLAALWRALGAMLAVFLFVYPMYLRTQQSFRERFGRHWNFARNELRTIEWTPTQ